MSSTMDTGLNQRSEWELVEIIGRMNAEIERINLARDGNHIQIAEQQAEIEKLKNENERLCRLVDIDTFELERLRHIEAAAKEIYFAGHWSTPAHTQEHQIALWNKLKDATGWSVTNGTGS